MITQVYIVMCRVRDENVPVAVCADFLAADHLRASLDTKTVRRDIDTMMRQGAAIHDIRAAQLVNGMVFSVVEAPFTDGAEMQLVMQAFAGRRAIELRGKL